MHAELLSLCDKDLDKYQKNLKNELESLTENELKAFAQEYNHDEESRKNAAGKMTIVTSKPYYAHIGLNDEMKRKVDAGAPGMREEVRELIQKTYVMLALRDALGSADNLSTDKRIYNITAFFSELANGEQALVRPRKGVQKNNPNSWFGKIANAANATTGAKFVESVQSVLAKYSDISFMRDLAAKVQRKEPQPPASSNSPGK